MGNTIVTARQCFAEPGLVVFPACAAFTVSGSTSFILRS
jgi:hypothetical protein